MAAGTVPGTVFVADELEGTVEIHHRVPRCLLRLHDEAHARRRFPGRRGHRGVA